MLQILYISFKWWLIASAIITAAYVLVYWLKVSVDRRDASRLQQQAIHAMQIGIRVEFYDRLSNNTIKSGRVRKFDRNRAYAIVRTESGEMCATDFNAIIRKL
ncbi:MAG: hypothetical protein JXR39_11430 [Marinilabiliaceae bacterium]|nr:hypothetical protein [Marinilabiliaceae bacterium]